MFSTLSEIANKTQINRSDLNGILPFTDYIQQCRELIQHKRADLHQAGINAQQVIEANSPFELRKANLDHYQYGALLIHGLFDCPLSLRDIGNQLQANGILTRSILLPGHGTVPSDLLRVDYEEWVQTVRYGVESLSHEVDHVILVGYSMGAALALHHALQDSRIAKIIMIAPAIKIKAPVDIVVNWHKFLKLFSRKKEWIYQEDETDYAKYQSIAFNPVTQISRLIEHTNQLQTQHTLHCPIFMVMSREDETVSSHIAIDFFSTLRHPDSRLLLYTSSKHRYPDARIKPRLTHYPKLHIHHFSHIASLFQPNNVHYGVTGDYVHASHTHRKDFIYGAFNHLEVSIFDVLYNLGLVGNRRRELTYNPDFDHMANEINTFIQTT